MVMQIREKGKKARWKDYPGKDKLDGAMSDYQFRLLNKEKNKVLWPIGKEFSDYNDVLTNLKRIEFFKHRNQGSYSDEDGQEFLYYPSGEPIPEKRRKQFFTEIEKVKKNQGSFCKKVFKKYQTKKKGGQRYLIKNNSYKSVDEAVSIYSLDKKKYGGKQK